MSAQILPFLLLIKTLRSQTGCNTSTPGVSDGYTFKQDLVYGCNAQWSKDKRGVEDVGEDVCANGYHVCGDEKDGQTFTDMWQLSYAECVTSSAPADSFYASNMRSTDGKTCGDDGNRKVFGCGNPATGYIFEDSATGCGPFGLTLSAESVNNSAADFGWFPCGGEQWGPCNMERERVYHNISGGGGIMCCRDTIAGKCQSQSAQNCAGCAKYGPCLNSVDPKCFSTEALDCLPCEEYAVCGMCAPGWDVGCIAEEWHQAEDAIGIKNDGTWNITDPVNYNLGTTCQKCDQCADDGSLTTQLGHRATPIPFMMNGECMFNPIFGQVGRSNCTLGVDGDKSGKATAWILTPDGLMPDINYTNPDPNWRDVLNCSGIAVNVTKEPGQGPDNSVTYGSPVDWNINIENASNAICYNSTFSEDCDWNEGKVCSDKLFGICGNEAAKCPGALHCGPQACDPDSNPFCIHIEIFGDTKPCTTTDTKNAGDYEAFVIADDTCRMDGSGRSYYKLGCVSDMVSGVLGCLDSNCTNCAQNVSNMAPDTCHNEPWLGGLEIVGIFNDKSAACVYPTTEPTSDPTMDPTEEPTLATQSPQPCDNGNGCNETYSSCAYEFLPNRVYGCNAQYTQGGLENGETEQICADGYHICGDSEEDPDKFTSIWGLTASDCVSTNIPLNSFFPTLLKSNDGINCNDDGSDNVFGCGNPNTAFLSNSSGCGPFGMVLSNDSLAQDSLKYGWSVCPDSGECPTNEWNNVKHTKEQHGGVMCCRDKVDSFCQSQSAQNCAGCAKYGPCLNSVDPKCFSTEALDCLDCEKYAICGMCAPGWDVGCIVEEWHQTDKAIGIKNDGTWNITNQTAYELGTTCQNCDQCVEDSSVSAQFGHRATPIPFMINGECMFMAAFGAAVIGDCTTNGKWNFNDGKILAWVDSDNGMVADINMTNPDPNWRSVLQCGTANATRDKGQGPDNSITYPNPVDWNINIENASNAICYNSTFSEDCDWNEGKVCSDKLWGICGNDAAKCPSALHCGPQACDPDSNPFCIHIEIFGDKPCTTTDTKNAGDYEAFVIADDTCRMDGSGRSYYKLGCVSDMVSGVLGCLNDNCTNCAQNVSNMPPDTCHNEPWLGGLEIVGIFNDKSAACKYPTTEPTTVPTLYPTEDPTIATQSPQPCDNGNGCNETYSECTYEFVEGRVYGCSGTIGSLYNPGIDNDDTEQMCAEGYHVCGPLDDADDYTTIWGLEKSECVSSNIPLNSFFASAWQSLDGVNCQDDEGEFGENNLFGCGNPNTPWLYGTDGCGPMGVVMSNQSAPLSSKYGWEPCGTETNQRECSKRERGRVLKTKSQHGGVMCCRDTTTSYCQSQGAQDCAACAEYGPCLNSVDPKCFSTQALDCLPCEEYAICAACAPGWDVGCIVEEWHQTEKAIGIKNDGTWNITNQTAYELGTTCQNCDQCKSEQSIFGRRGTPIPFLQNGHCTYNSIFGIVGIADCVSNKVGSSVGTVNKWKLSPNGLMPDINYTNPDANWRDTFNCSGIVVNRTREKGQGPGNSITYPDPIDYNVNISNASDAICYNSTFSEDCEWNDGKVCSDKLWGVCGNEVQKCPGALHCGPQGCDLNTEDYCIQIEIFGVNSTCEAVVDKGDYAANVIADHTCRMDGSGRSYYKLGCDSDAEAISGVLGCVNSDCTECTQTIDSMAPNVCHNEDWLNGLTIAGIMDSAKVCKPQSPTPSPTNPSPSPTRSPLAAGQTFSPSVDPTKAPSRSPLAAGVTHAPTTAMPTGSPTVNIVTEGCEVCNDNVNNQQAGNLDDNAVTGCDDGCGDGPSLNMSLSFDSCDVSAFNNNKCGLWNGVADCICAQVMTSDSINSNIGRGDNPCGIEVVDYSMTTVSSSFDGCTGAGNSLSFALEDCSNCDTLDIIEDGFEAAANDKLVTDILACIGDLGLKQVKSGSLTYVRQVSDDCGEVDGDAASWVFEKSVIAVIIPIVMAMITF